MERDVESQQRTKISHWTMVADQGVITPEVRDYPYKGSGTAEDPYLVEWIPNDPRNPQLFSPLKKWTITALVAIATLAVAFVSSAFSGGVQEILIQFHASYEVGVLGISLFVLGFAIGPLLWAPLSEMFGRQYLFIGTYAALTAFNAGSCGAQNIGTLIVLRFLAGAFGSSPLTNAGGVIADMFAAEQRGVAISFFATAPFMGPVLGPIVGGFVGETVGWRWIQGVMAIFTGVLWIIGSVCIPETYPPVLLRQRAARLSKLTGKHYVSKTDADQGRSSFGTVFKAALLRPWILLFTEPIVLLLSIYMSIIYGVLYMLFGAFPIVYQQHRGWTQGIGGLAFLGVAVGMIGAVAYNLWDNKRYVKILREHKGFAPPEARLPPANIGSVAIVIGLFWFAWTNSPSIHWIVSILAGVPFGFGMVLVFLSVFNYLIDAYVIFAASVLAANSVLRSLFGAAFPLFTRQMYANLGIHWASTIPAFLALACLPMPILLYKYGPAIRARCKFAAQAAAFMQRLQNQQVKPAPTEEEEVKRHESHDTSSSDDEHFQPQFEEMRTENETRRDGDGAALQKTKSYEGNPYDIDRVATRESFGVKANRTLSREA
ncbi:MFS general substrate transporter [Myriangium duriaei CBS 260.36]|uniref:MFS general substrate transporter n=1 Tax=Myriangium duriaei CBS 260.36 TaxID=1168546 RepID=A0A9P4J9V8_9PEZI|nr:MFS general substrate transporter [Myriangium duriaei CBS 260.36]